MDKCLACGAEVFSLHIAANKYIPCDTNTVQEDCEPIRDINGDIQLVVRHQMTCPQGGKMASSKSTSTAKCKACGEEIWFLQTGDKESLPINYGGWLSTNRIITDYTGEQWVITPHFLTCDSSRTSRSI